MIPIVLEVDGSAIYFNPVMFPCDELQPNHPVIFDVKADQLFMYQADIEITIDQLDLYNAYTQQLGYVGCNLVKRVEEDHVVIDNGCGELLKLNINNHALTSVDTIPN